MDLPIRAGEIARLLFKRRYSAGVFRGRAECRSRCGLACRALHINANSSAANYSPTAELFASFPLFFPIDLRQRRTVNAGGFRGGDAGVEGPLCRAKFQLKRFPADSGALQQEDNRSDGLRFNSRFPLSRSRAFSVSRSFFSLFPAAFSQPLRFHEGNVPVKRDNLLTFHSPGVDIFVFIVALLKDD